MWIWWCWVWVGACRMVFISGFLERFVSGLCLPSTLTMYFQMSMACASHGFTSSPSRTGLDRKQRNLKVGLFLHVGLNTINHQCTFLTILSTKMRMSKGEHLMLAIVGFCNYSCFSFFINLGSWQIVSSGGGCCSCVGSVPPPPDNEGPLDPDVAAEEDLVKEQMVANYEVLWQHMNFFLQTCTCLIHESSYFWLLDGITIM